MNHASQGPPAPTIDKAYATTKARSALRQAIWEASRFLPYAELETFCASVIHEIQDDDA